MPTPPRRRPTVPPLSELDAPSRGPRDADPTPEPADPETPAPDATGSTADPGPSTGRRRIAGGRWPRSGPDPARSGPDPARGGTVDPDADADHEDMGEKSGPVAGGGGREDGTGAGEEGRVTTGPEPGTGGGDRPGAGGGRGPGGRGPAGPRAGADASGRRRSAGVDEALWGRDDEETQRAVAEERAVAARAVLAERAAAVAAGPRGRVPVGPVLIGVAGLILVLRLWLVGVGALFGAGPVLAADVAVAVLLALGLALSPLPRPRSALVRPAGRGRRLAVVLAVPMLVGTGLALAQPATPTSAPAPACPAVPVRGGAGTVVTTAEVVTREGPGRAYPASGRLPAGCAVGLSGWCLGDPLPAGVDGWSDSRWLMVHRGGPVARHVSGEPDRPRFLPAAATSPEAVAGLPLLSTADCGADGLRVPGDTALEVVAVDRPDSDNIGARAPRAANIGFAVWVAPDPVTGIAPLLRGEAYQQIGGGSTAPSGRRTVRWDFRALLRDLNPTRRTADVSLAVLAVACDGPGAARPANSAEVTTYEIVEGRITLPRLRLRGGQARTEPALTDLDLPRLTATACQPPA